MTAMAVETAQVGVSRLADGTLVRLTGALGCEQLHDLRQVLLSPLPRGCRDVIVDAGEVTAVDDPALAVLVAAREWVETQGARFRLSRSSEALQAALSACGLEDGLPRLSELPRAPQQPTMPRPRSVD